MPDFGQNVVPNFFFREFYLVDVASYHCIQFQGNLLNQTWKIAENLVLGTILAALAQIWALQFCFLWILPLLDVRH